MKYISTNQNQSFVKKIYKLALVIALLLFPFIGKAQTTISGTSTNTQTTYIVPAGVCKVAVECVGGGGGGGNSNSGGGKGGGAYSFGIIDVSNIDKLYIQAGKYGTNGSSNGGGESYVKSGSYAGTTLVSANGGGSAVDKTTKGSGGAASTIIGNISTKGGDGGDGGANGGGGAGGMGGAGGNAPTGKYDGGWPGFGNPHTCNGYGGWGGNGTNGYNGEYYGGGGGGAGYGKSGSSGGIGAVLIYPYLCDAITAPITNTGADVLCSGGTTTLQANLPTGGAITNYTGDGNNGTNGVYYYVHKFTASGDRFNTLGPIGADYLMVGGGGAGGAHGGGGGGAGEFISASGVTVNTGMYPVFVGKGGSTINNSIYNNNHPGFRGGVSYFKGIIANGGGGGASREGNGGGPALTGGSGGGGAGAATSESATAGNSVKLGSGSGNNGGAGINNSGSCLFGGGGGGAGSAGNAGTNPGVGGEGLTSAITGTNLYYAAGGGSCSCDNVNIKAGGSGIGGGGNGGNNALPVPNTGSGGGGGKRSSAGQAGADGIVIIRYPKGTWSSSNAAIASVSSSGVVTAGTTAGTATISYTIGGQTYGTYTITVKNPSVAPTLITGTTTICTGGNTTLTNNDGTIGTDAVKVWYQGGCGDDASFDQNWNTQPYTTYSTTVNSNTNGILNLTSTSNDPMIEMPNLGTFNAATYRYVNIRYKVISGTAGNVEIFFLNGHYNYPHGDHHTYAPLVSNNQWQTVSVDMHQNSHYLNDGSNITGWRFDWATASGVNMEIDFISLSQYPIIGQGNSITVSPTATTTYATKIKGYCNNTSCASTTVTVVPQIVAPTLNVKTPNNINVCAGTSVNATINAGSGGSGASDTYEYRTNGGSWLAYTSGSGISTSSISSVDIRVSRSAGTGSDCNATGPTIIASWIVDPTSVGGTVSPAVQNLCGSGTPSNITLSGHTGSIQWQSSPDNSTWTDMSGKTTNTLSLGTLSATTYYRAKVTSGVCSDAFSSVAVVYTNDDDASGSIASATSTRICEVKDNNWHYFRNGAGEIIAGINSQNVDLGNVTITVHVESTAPEFRDGGHGREDACFGKPELAVKRWYEITPSKNAKNIPIGSPTLVKLYFTDNDYTEYVTKIAGWDATHPTPLSYGMCYGTTNGKGDLVVSKDEVLDLSPTSYNIDQTKQFTEYQIAVPSFSTFHFHTNGGIGGPLPIELLSFTGIYNSTQNINELTWITASEKNTNRFEIEKSLDGENWTTIGSVNANGNVTENKTYNFDDTNPLIGNNYYRLKSIDNDASFEYSNIVRIQVKGHAIADEVAKIFPNPTHAILNVWLVSTQIQNLVFNVSDALGKTVQQFEKQVEGGMNKLEFDVRNLSSGTYILHYIDSKGNKHHYKFVKD